MPATCRSCQKYHQKGRGAGVCALEIPEQFGKWETPDTPACKEYTADSPDGV